MDEAQTEQGWEDNQGSLEWFRDRLGMITMSDSRINMLMHGSPAKRNKLLETLLHERQIRENEELLLQAYEKSVLVSDRVNQLAWGRANERIALSEYSLRRNIDIIRPGFRRHPKWPDLFGSSADFLEIEVKTRQVLAVGEAKCYYDEKKHLSALRHGMLTDHHHQTQGHMEVWGLDQGRFLSFDPRLTIPEKQLYIETFQKDEKWSALFQERAEEFAEYFYNDLRFHENKYTSEIPQLF